MAIQLDSESLLTLQAAARSLPGHPHISTLHRWRLRGIRGVRLETCLIGGSRYTSKEALQCFIDSTSKAAGVNPAPADAPLKLHSPGIVRRHRRGTLAAKRLLDVAGI